MAWDTPQSLWNLTKHRTADTNINTFQSYGTTKYTNTKYILKWKMVEHTSWLTKNLKILTSHFLINTKLLKCTLTCTPGHIHMHAHIHTHVYSVPIITICHEFITILVSPLPSIMSIQSSIGRLDNLIVIHAAKMIYHWSYVEIKKK